MQLVKESVKMYSAKSGESGTDEESGGGGKFSSRMEIFHDDLSTIDLKNYDEVCEIIRLQSSAIQQVWSLTQFCSLFFFMRNQIEACVLRKDS